MERDSGLDVIKLSDKDFLRTLENGCAHVTLHSATACCQLVHAERRSHVLVLIATAAVAALLKWRGLAAKRG
jgi:hypothetical protein